MVVKLSGIYCCENSDNFCFAARAGKSFQSPERFAVMIGTLHKVCIF